MNKLTIEMDIAQKPYEKDDPDNIFEYDKKVLNAAIETIKAQQQDIDILNMGIAELRESNQALKDYAENADADKDEQAGRIMRYDTALRQAKEALKYCAISACKPAQGVVESQIRAIDALLGGKKDG